MISVSQLTTASLANLFDHTQLHADARRADFEKLCAESREYGFKMVAINPAPVALCKELLAGTPVHVGAAIGFPLGQNGVESKVFETQQAVREGASEVDMVVNLGDVKNGDFDAVEKEIEALKKAAGDNVLKVIVETCYLTQEEKIRLCECVTQAGADYIKTSTGFGTAGATLEDIALFRAHIGPQVKVKAAGGIRTREDLEAFCNAGCDRLGCSAAVKVLREKG